ncbi:MAG: response regulator transcription factor, partial [Nitrospirales bacterium]|nr:response regulator transcription factor [Nitrospirales bacterium]
TAYLRMILGAGAEGYVCKRVADSELLTAIRAVQKGKMYIKSTVEKGFVETLPPPLPPRNWPISHDSEFLLSRREKEVLLLVAQGLTNREIATQFSVSIKSIETYRLRLMHKLNLKNRAALYRFVHDRRLLRDSENGF